MRLEIKQTLVRDEAAKQMVIAAMLSAMPVKGASELRDVRIGPNIFPFTLSQPMQ